MTDRTPPNSREGHDAARKRGPWRRGTIRFFWRERVNEVAPVYLRLRRRNPVDYMKIRLWRLEVWL